VIVPAGDQQAAVSAPTDLVGIENVTVVGAATPGSKGNYLRWWSSNYYSDDNTVTTFVPGGPNVCAWGGGVVTTGGNANLTMLTVANSYTEDTVTGEYTLTPQGKQWSFTNDFGANLDGTIAAAAQVAAATACAQGFCRDWFGNPLLPDRMQARLWSTALVGNSDVTPAGIAGDAPDNFNGTYTWDLDQENESTRSVGRMPQMGRLIRNLYEYPPNDDEFSVDDGCPYRLLGLDVITGTIIDGHWVQLTVADEDEWLTLRSVQAGPGHAASVPNMPKPVHYPWSRDITDIMLTFEGGCNLPFDGIDSIRGGLEFDGQYIVYIFDFPRNVWRALEDDDLPMDAPLFAALPRPGTPPGLSRYLQPQPDGSYRFYVRVFTQGELLEPYVWYLDWIDLATRLDTRP
jgi:hypothetical protein